MVLNGGGRLVKIARRDDVDLILQRGLKSRPAARFNRQGQDALYLSPDELSARIAIGQYIQNIDHSRVLLTFQIGPCHLFDLRTPVNSDLYETAKQPWLKPLANGQDPASWHAADRLRDMGYDGLIDPSRRRPGFWHITLFRWNSRGAPNVKQIGDVKPVILQPGFR